MKDRRIDVFFYGLFMDDELLRENGVDAANPVVLSSTTTRSDSDDAPRS